MEFKEIDDGLPHDPLPSLHRVACQTYTSWWIFLVSAVKVKKNIYLNLFLCTSFQNIVVFSSGAVPLLALVTGYHVKTKQSKSEITDKDY